MWLGHDGPQYKVDHNWLDKRRHYLWLHCKNLEAAKECWSYHSFCHTEDPFTYTSTGKIWLHDISMKIDQNVIIPLIDKNDITGLTDTTFFDMAYGVCTDYPSYV